jgi:hypothetical protein
MGSATPINSAGLTIDNDLNPFANPKFEQKGPGQTDERPDHLLCRYWFGEKR